MLNAWQCFSDKPNEHITLKFRLEFKKHIFGQNYTWSLILHYKKTKYEKL